MQWILYFFGFILVGHVIARICVRLGIIDEYDTDKSKDGNKTTDDAKPVRATPPPIVQQSRNKPKTRIARKSPKTTCARLENYVVVDIETTGFNPTAHQIIEIAAIKVINGKPDKIFSTLVGYGGNLPDHIIELTGITTEEAKKAPDRRHVLSQFDEFIEDLPLVGHNIADFDNKFLWCSRIAVSLPQKHNPVVDTLKISREVLVCDRYKLGYLCEVFDISTEQPHRALYDAKRTWKLFEMIMDEHSPEIELRKTHYHGLTPDRLQPKYARPDTNSAEPKNKQIDGKRFAITTFMPFYHFNTQVDFEQFIVNNGGTFGGVAQSTDYLVDCDPNYISGKERKVRDNVARGKATTKIISPKEFVKMIKRG